MALHLEAKKVPLHEIMQTIHKSDLEKLEAMHIQGEANFVLDLLDTSSLDQAPNLEVVFSLKNGSLKHDESSTRIDELSFLGKLSKIAGKEERLTLENCLVKTMGQRLEGRFSMENFSNPRVDVRAQGQVDLKALHFFFPIPKVQEISGAVYVDSDFSADILNSGTPQQQALLRYSRSDLDCKNVKLDLEGDFPVLERVSGYVTMKNDDFVFRDFQINTTQSDFLLNGAVNNVIGYLEQAQNLELKAALQAKKINVNEFISNSAASESQSSGVGEFLLPKNILGSLLCSVETLQVDNHEFKKLETHLALQNRRIHLEKLTLQHLGSSIKGNVMLVENRASWIEIEGAAETNSVNLKDLFKEWKNFEQETIKSENIRGYADAQMQFYLPFNVNSGLNKERMRADVSLRVQNGALVQVESLKEIARSMQSYGPARVVLGKNLPQIEQKLANLTFETLENKFSVENSKFVIPKMLIKTNLMEVVVSGWQHFDESLEYRFEFDFKDLKVKKRDSEFGEIVEDGVSSRLFLKMFGTLSDLKFAWDTEAKKAYKKEQNEQEKANVKSMLKSEFGMFKKDTTVGAYQQKEKVRERISIDFGEDTLKTQEELKTRNRVIHDKFKKIREANKPKEEKLIIEIDS